MGKLINYLTLKMPKAATQRRSPSKPSSKYDYCEINKAELSENDNVHNFYGVVVDASFPYQFSCKSSVNGSDKLFQCVLKVVDPDRANSGLVPAKSGMYSGYSFFCTHT